MKIAIVILNWNGKELLEQFLPSIIEHSASANIYVADNASTDESLNIINNNFSSVKIIKNKTNLGFAGGYNNALKEVNEEIICLLNSDVEVTRNWLTPIIEQFKTEDNTAVIQPKILDFKDKAKFEYAGAAGGYIDKYGFPYCRGRIFNIIEKDTNQYSKKQDIFWASGACFFIRNSVFKKLDGFDKSFFAHMEEIDLCWRVKNHGFNISYNGNSLVYHVGGATLKNTNPKKTFLNFRNSLLMLVKNAQKPIFSLILVRLCLDGIAGILFLLKLKPLHCFAIIKAHFSFYSKLTFTLKQRKSLNQNIKHYKTTSIVWSYYINRKTTFNKL